MVGWCTLFLTVVGKEPPETSMIEDLDEREINHWWKAKKWSYANLNRLYVRCVDTHQCDSARLTKIQIWQPSCPGQEQRGRLHRGRQELHRQLRSRDPQGLSPAGREVGRQAGMALKGQSVLHPELPGPHDHLHPFSFDKKGNGFLRHAVGVARNDIVRHFLHAAGNPVRPGS